MRHAPLEMARKVIHTLKEKGHKALIAGGWVRDYFMHIPSDDIDIATDASTEEIQKLFPKTLSVGVQFGIVIVVLEGHQFEVATFRTESEYLDARRPSKVQAGTLEEDAQRRDFTINGMYYDPDTSDVIDLVQGKRDIEAKVIQAIGNAHERIQEDRLRMIRAVRYAVRFGFTIEKLTQEAILAHAGELFPAVSIERIIAELQKMAAFSPMAKSLSELHKYHLLQEIFPQTRDLQQQELKERLIHVPQFPKETPLIAILYELLPPLSLTEKLTVCERFKLSNADKEFTEHYHAWSVTDMRDGVAWVKLYAHKDAEICCELLAVKQEAPDVYRNTHYRRQKRWHQAILRQQNHKTLIDAKMLMEKGIQPGKAMGELIAKGESYSIEHHTDDPEEVLRHLFPKGAL